jgi:hypothetical protein
MDALASIIRDLLIFIGVMAVLLVGLLIAMIRLPARHPMKRLITALALRVGASLGAGLLALPIEPVPGLDVLYDIGAPVALIWFWYTFFRYAARRGIVMDHDPRGL